MKHANTILSRVKMLERYQGLLGKHRRDAERQIIIGAVNMIVGTLERQRIEIDNNAVFEAIRDGIRSAEKYYEAALDADKMLPFGSPLPGNPPRFTDSLQLCLSVATTHYITAVHTKITEKREAANAKAKAETIAAAAQLPEEPPMPQPRCGMEMDAETKQYFAALRAAVERPTND